VALARRTLLLQQSIHIACPPGTQQQTAAAGLLQLAHAGIDRRTDGHCYVT